MPENVKTIIDPKTRRRVDLPASEADAILAKAAAEKAAKAAEEKAAKERKNEPAGETKE